MENKPQTLVNDANPNSGLDSFLSGYVNPLTLNPNPVNGNGNSSQPVMNPTLSKPLISTVQQVEQRFYKTGKKAGQPKPNKPLGNTVHPSPQATGQPVPNGQINNTLISGALFITLVDVLIPLVISVANNTFTKTKIEATELKLSEAERKDLEPLCNEVVKYLNITANPVVLLLVSLGGLYSMKFMLQKSLNEAKAKVKKDDYGK